MNFEKIIQKYPFLNFITINTGKILLLEVDDKYDTFLEKEFNRDYQQFLKILLENDVKYIITVGDMKDKYYLIQMFIQRSSSIYCVRKVSSELTLKIKKEIRLHKLKFIL